MNMVLLTTQQYENLIRAVREANATAIGLSKRVTELEITQIDKVQRNINDLALAIGTEVGVTPVGPGKGVAA